MNAGQRSARRIAANTGPLSRDTVCISCRHRLTYTPHRNAATAAASVDPSLTPLTPSPQDVAPATASGSVSKAYALLASPVLSRPPLLTRELNAFEKSYYLYQKRLNERLSLPFSRYFYYKKGTPGDLEWKRKIAYRKTAAKDIGEYSAYGDEAWNDEVLVGSKLREHNEIVGALIRDAEGKSVVEGKDAEDVEKSKSQQDALSIAQQALTQVEIEKPQSRLTEADQTNNTKSLNRKLDRTLYLLIQNKDGRWRFPEDRVYGRENLHQAAERIIVQAGGINMNTWLVANHPVGHHIYNYPAPSTKNVPAGAAPAGPNGGRLATITPNAMVPTSLTVGPVQREEFGEKLFFMKGRIMGGQVELASNEYKDKDFAWLTKEEIMARVTEKYWKSVKNMLADR